LKPLKTL